VSELRDRLEALATRGTRRGADDVLNAAQRDAQTTSPDENTTDLDSTDMEIIDDDLPVVAFEPGPRRRRRFGSFVASAGIAALVGVGALAITAMFGSGGAGSPEGAVRQLAAAVNNKDALAAVDVLVPSEVRSMRESVKHVTERAAALHIVNEASKPLAGVDLSVDHLELRTEPLADGYAKVIITSGEFSASTHREQLSTLLQKAQRDGKDAQNHADLSKLAADAGIPTFVVVVRHGGGWYVSPAYTTLEYIREVDLYPVADFGSAKAAELGAATPEGAVNDALHAWQAADWNRLIALAPPDELPVYDYRAMIAAAAADLRPDFSIDSVSTTSTVDGDTAVVKLEASGTFGSDPVQHWQVGGTCPAAPLRRFGFAPPYEGPSSSSSASAPELCLAGDLGQAVPFGLVTVGLSGSETTSGPVSIELVREGGRWFVSPVTTALNLLDSSIDHIDARTVYAVLGIAWDLPPDSTLTLNRPFEVPAPTSYLSPRVYSFDGQAGQEVVPSDGVSGSDSSGSGASGEIFTADGHDVGYVEFGSYPSSVTLPSSGGYRLVLNAYGVPSAGTTLTLWDLANAPKSLRDRALSSGETCTSSGGLLLGGPSTSCRSSATAVPSPLATGSSTDALSGSCAVTNNTLTCGSVTLGRVCPTGTAPSATNECLTPEAIAQLLAGQSQSGSGVVTATTGSTPPTTAPATSAPATTAP
jgi:hypothetical protein